MTFYNSSLTILLVAVVTALCGCQRTSEKDRMMSSTGIGKFVYCDDNGVYHVDAECSQLRNGTDRNGHAIYAKHVIDTLDFVIKDDANFRVCASCVSDSISDGLSQLSNRNLFGDVTLDLKEMSFRRKIYLALVDDNYYMPEFRIFNDSLEHADVRMKLYMIAKNNEWIGDQSEEEFSNKLGFHSITVNMD